MKYYILLLIFYLKHEIFFSCTRSLLVLDDIWDSWVLKAFDNQCQVLITSRDRSVTDAVSGKEWSSLLHYKLWMYVYAECFCELLKELDRIHVYQVVHKWQMLYKTMLFHEMHVICCPVYMSILRITALFSKLAWLTLLCLNWLSLHMK